MDRYGDDAEDMPYVHAIDHDQDHDSSLDHELHPANGHNGFIADIAPSADDPVILEDVALEMDDDEANYERHRLPIEMNPNIPIGQTIELEQSLTRDSLKDIGDIKEDINPIAISPHSDLSANGSPSNGVDIPRRQRAGSHLAYSKRKRLENGMGDVNIENIASDQRRGRSNTYHQGFGLGKTAKLKDRGSVEMQNIAQKYRPRIFSQIDRLVHVFIFRQLVFKVFFL